MQTLIPSAVTARTEAQGRLGGVFGFTFTARCLLLLAAGCLFSIPAFFHAHRLWLMFVWDGVVLGLFVVDLSMLPGPGRFTLSRRFLTSPQVGVAVEVELTCLHQERRLLHVLMMDDLNASLTPMPQALAVDAYPRDEAKVTVSCFPRERGLVGLGNVYLRVRGAFGLAERRSVARLAQTITVFPATELAESDSQMYLMRARQIEQQRRKLQRIGIGREFQNLRDYQMGDEMRDISWRATARHSRVITRQFSTERSQQVWIVLDAGRLSRTNFMTTRKAASRGLQASQSLSEIEQGESIELSLTQLDQAATCAVLLARVIESSGDKFGLLTYGRGIQQQMAPGRGAVHLRLLIDSLAKTRSELAEAEPRTAGLRLRNLQRRRSLILWILEVAETASRPDIAVAAADLAKRHLVVLVLLRHPELNEVATADPEDKAAMYLSAAAQQMLARQREMVRSLRALGILVVETTPKDMAEGAINTYLEVKAQGRV